MMKSTQHTGSHQTTIKEIGDPSFRENAPASPEKPPCDTQRGPDGAWAWMVCISGMLSCIIVFGCCYNFGLLFPLLLDEFKEGKAKTAWIGSLAVSSSGLLAPISGKLCKNVGPRLVIVSGALLCASGLLLTTQVPSISWMYATYGGLFGLGSSAIYMATFVEVPKHFVKRRSLATAMIAMGPGGGLFIMSPVVQALLDTLHWRHALMALAGIVALCGFLGCTYSKSLSDNRYSDQQPLRDNESAVPIRGTEDPALIRNRLPFLRNPLYVSVTLIVSLAYVGHTVPPVHLIRYSQDHGISASLASHFFLCSGLGSQVARLVTGRLCDFRWFRPIMFTHAGLLLSGTATLLLPQMTSYSMLLVFSLLYGISDGLAACGHILTILSCLRAPETPMGFGINQVITSIAFAGGPPLGGLIADIYGSYIPAFYLAGGVTMFGVLALFSTYCLKPADGKSVDDDKGTSLELLVVMEKVSVL